MARPRKYIINLTEDEFKELKSIIRKKRHPKPYAADARSSLIWTKHMEKS